MANTAIEKARDEIADCLTLVWAIKKPSEGLFLDVVELMLLSRKGDANSWRGMQMMFDISPGALENGIVSWENSSSYVSDVWNAIQKRFGFTEYPLGVLNLPRRIEGLEDRYRECKKKIPGMVESFENYLHSNASI